ncbi:TPA: transporter substrate-binding domain-containing protein, partial [Enterococcus faecium]
AVNQALEEMHADGTYDKIYQKWFPNETEGKVE